MRSIRPVARSYCARASQANGSFSAAVAAADQSTARLPSHFQSNRTSLASAINLNASSSTVRSFSSAGHQLSDILAREHAEELENQLTAVPEELAAVKALVAKTWKIVDDGAVTRLYRTLTDTDTPIKVQISFHCQDTVQVVDEYLEEEADKEEAADPVRFTVTCTKAVGKTLVFTCVSEDATTRIQSVAITNQTVESIQANSGVDSMQYQGPDFTELAEDLQDAFHAYLEEEVGLNEDVASFIAMHTDHKEETEYVDFLEEARVLLE